MKTKIIFLVPFLLLSGCHSASITKFDERAYPPTTRVDIFTDLSTIPEAYVEIGYVEAKGGRTVSKQALLDDMKEEAMKQGANALIKVEFYDKQSYNAKTGSYEKPAARAVMIRYKSTMRK